MNIIYESDIAISVGDFIGAMNLLEGVKDKEAKKRYRALKKLFASKHGKIKTREGEPCCYSLDENWSKLAYPYPNFEKEAAKI